MDIQQRIAGLDALWRTTMGDPQICIAVLDGPVDLTHACFAGGRFSHPETLVSAEAGDNAASRHGTHVASVIFGQHDSPVTGIAPGCRGLIVPIYSTDMVDRMACSQLDLARAINLAVIHGAQIINISGGQYVAGGAADPLLTQAIQRCSEAGVLIVAAAGNNGCDCLHVPAAVPSVLAVGAMSESAEPMLFSNWGDGYQNQGILALGENILGAVPGGDIEHKTGTSFATPIVSGLAALLMSEQIARGEMPDVGRVRAAILGAAEPCIPELDGDCRRILAGRLEVTSARARLFASDQELTPAEMKPSGSTQPMLSTHDNRNAVDQQAIVAASAMSRTPTNSRSTGPPVAPCDSEIAPKTISNPNQIEVIMSDTIESTHDETGSVDPALLSPSAIPESMPITAEIPIANGLPEFPSPAIAGQSLTAPAAEVIAAECESCAAAESTSPALAYALGQLGFDFGTESRRDQFVQLSDRNVHDPLQLLAHLDENPSSAANLVWTLSLDTTVVYAVSPYGPFAASGYEAMRQAMKAQLTEGAERLSVPGYVQGSTRLMNGQVVPYLYPDFRGVFSWHTPALITSVLGTAPEQPEAAEAHALEAEGIQNFLERVYYEVRNLGITPQERAMNYAATNAFQLATIYKDAAATGMKLDGIDVEPSPICRPGSECWDVKLTFFNPSKRMEQARHVHRFTVDVSEVIPVTVGKVRHWDIY